MPLWIIILLLFETWYHSICCLFSSLPMCYFQRVISLLRENSCEYSNSIDCIKYLNDCLLFHLDYPNYSQVEVKAIQRGIRILIAWFGQLFPIDSICFLDISSVSIRDDQKPSSIHAIVLELLLKSTSSTCLCSA